MYTANETADQNVWFDDLKVTFTPQLIVQENHYYPFGLELKGISKENKPEHRWKFQGQEEQKEFGLNWSSFKFRNADMALGRFFSVDPLAEDYYYNSVYAFSENQVTAHFELEGLEKKEAKKGLVIGAGYYAGKKTIEQSTVNTIKNVAGRRVTTSGFFGGAIRVLGIVGAVLMPSNYSETPEKKWHEQHMNNLRRGGGNSFKKEPFNSLNEPSKQSDRHPSTYSPDEIAQSQERVNKGFADEQDIKVVQWNDLNLQVKKLENDVKHALNIWDLFIQDYEPTGDLVKSIDRQIKEIGDDIDVNRDSGGSKKERRRLYKKLTELEEHRVEAVRHEARKMNPTAYQNLQDGREKLREMRKKFIGFK